MDNSNIWIVILLIIIPFVGSLLKGKAQRVEMEGDYQLDEETLAKRRAAADIVLAKLAAESSLPNSKAKKKRDKLPENSIDSIDEAEKEPLFANLDEVKKAVITAEILQRKF